MGTANARTVHLNVSTQRRRPRNGEAPGLYVSRSAWAEPEPVDPERRLRELAATGTLTAAARGPERAGLTSAAYNLVWPIVFMRITRRFERQRGHAHCAAGVENLADECLDRFHDDVEAVVDDLLAHADRPIRQLEAWVATRVGAATVNAHRRRRGERGALQRPRLPGWLADGLCRDRWLTTLAVDILVWVGVSGTAGSELWPLESWAQERAACTGDWPGSDPATVRREIDQVLTVMRSRPEWFASFVERPLGAKQPPVMAMTLDPYGEPVAPLGLGDPDDRVESELRRLAADAVRDIGDRIGRGEPAEAAVAEVVRTVFGGVFTGTLDRAPHGGGDPLGGVTGALSDRQRLNAIVSAALTILDEPE
ncbi:hypothetical protein Aab01nite_78370 [Paractinoplanes abujensis]|uniref:Uncharacterized protein n=1 Tax=Paractinoplanes abujensis TaxID=882441 RepID=A0A7W7FZN8_9ACTN|nr:hypothetical protein [Actinoplanes abujensis]MBB4692273.1 hypothetical protein [Actinoplanes abujensis]GID24247.1 hypothetical protein Aab01nite_78370 [Actinoplanes abujensis]